MAGVNPAAAPPTGLTMKEAACFKDRAMDKVRGILMFAAGAFALYRGAVMLPRPNAWLAIALGLVAIALGVWRLTRKAPRRLM